jgi:hypothetical protein
MSNIQILVEIKPGIDPTDSTLINDDVGEHWLPDQNNILTITKQPVEVTNNYWIIDTDNILKLNDFGSSSLYWTLQTGNILQVNA